MHQNSHCGRWILQKPLQFAIHDSKETIPVLFGTIHCFGDGTTAGAQGGWKLGWGRLTHTQESNETPSRNDELVLEDQANSTKSAVTSLKVGRNTSCPPMKASFLCGVQVIQQVQDQGIQGIGGLKEVFHGATSNIQVTTFFFAMKTSGNRNRMKQDTWKYDSCHLLSIIEIVVQNSYPSFVPFHLFVFPLSSPGVPKHQLLCRELAPPPKKTWRNLHSVRQVVCFGMVRDSHLLTSNDSFKTLLQESTKTSKIPTQRSMRLGWGLNGLHKKSPYCCRQSVKKRKKRSRHGKEIDMSQV